jgi:hypothetical protein
VFGDQAVRTLAAKARKDLIRRAHEVLGHDRARFEDVLDGLGGAATGRGAALREAVRSLEITR